MKKVIYIAVLSVLLSMLLCSCKPVGTQNTDELTETVEIAYSEAETSVYEETSSEIPETTTEEAVTEPETVSETQTIPSTNPVTTTKASVITTKVPVVTTSKPVTTTTKITTVPAETYSAPTGQVKEYVTEKKTDTFDLKYDVMVTRTIEYKYRVYTNGKREVVSQKIITEVYNRTFFSANYNDMLSAVKANRKKYNDFINRVLELTNAMRAEKGIAPLVLDEGLTEQACVRAEEIAWSGVHSHYRPSGRYYTSIFKDNGRFKGTVGENIGWGYADAEAVCEAWRNSETHYQNIMDERFKKIGIGVAADCDPDHKLCWAQHFCSE